MMSRDLYFIPILEHALQKPDAETALREAFERIRKIGNRPGYEKGYRQFHRFMERTAAEASPVAEAPPESFRIEVMVEKDGERAAMLRLGPQARAASLEDLSPGRYTIKLWTGRTLWEGRLGEEDLIWTEAFPGEPLRLAADTEGRKRRPSRVEKVMEGEFTLRVLPGVESGMLRLRWKGMENE